MAANPKLTALKRELRALLNIELGAVRDQVMQEWLDLLAAEESIAADRDSILERIMEAAMSRTNEGEENATHALKMWEEGWEREKERQALVHALDSEYSEAYRTVRRLTEGVESIDLTFLTPIQQERFIARLQKAHDQALTESSREHVAQLVTLLEEAATRTL